MKYGYFDDANHEYVITRPDTPLPWINFLGCQNYFGLISNTAGGYSFYQDARLRRLTRYRYNNVPFDMGGRYIYLRDNEPAETGNRTANFWSPTWQPTNRDLTTYECRHGMGYTAITSNYLDIRAQVRYFVPLDETLEIWDLTLTNTRSTTANLSIFSCIEFALWEALDDSSNFQRNFSTGQVEVEDGIIYHKTEYRERRNHFAFFACSQPLAGFDTQRESFLGPYRSWSNPVGVEKGYSANSMAFGWSPMGSHHILLTLNPGEEKRIVFVLGYHENDRGDKFDPPGSQRINKRTVLPRIHKYLQPETVQEAFSELKSYWNELLGKYQVQSPDEHTNRMVNIWNAYQCMVTFNLSRSASFYESGIGRGMGFRDSTQDLLGFVHMVPERARQRLLDLASTQFENGGAYHQYQPLTKRGNDNVGGNFNDDPLWLVLAATAYIKETGDWSILNEPTPFDNKPGSEAPFSEHLQRSLQYTLDHLGPHGLPLIGRADWNDCLNLNTFSEEPGESFQTTTQRDGKVAESIVIAGLFIIAAKEMADLSQEQGQLESVSYYLQQASKFEAVILQHGWDGAWFQRAYDHFGDKVGSKDCQEGQIFVEPQGLCIMAGVGVEMGLAHQALQSVADRLATPHGIILQQPAYSQYYLNLGEISSYPPGYKENAGIFCHTNPWIMIAETILNRGDRALDYYLRINPSAREALSELHRCEPYVYAQMIAGRDAPTHGEAKNSWLTGTAAWNYVAITQWILGIRPTYQGLKVSPVVPDTWNTFTVDRHFRGVDYHITVERDGPGNKVSLMVDGTPIEGDIIPLPAVGIREVQVLAVLSR
jgi:cellobiose phosphorylase